MRKKSRMVKLNTWQIVAIEEAVRSYWGASTVVGADRLVELITGALQIHVGLGEKSPVK